jgi:hypothetical protein
MKRLLAGLIIVGTSFAGTPQTPTQSSPMPQSMPPQPQPLPTTQAPSPMPPVEIKPEDKTIIDLKKKMSMKQTYNDYQKIDKATSIDRINLEKSLKESQYSLKAQILKEKQLDAQVPYYYTIPVKGVVGDVVLTDQMPLKDGAVLKGKDRISVKNGLVYIGDYLISYPVMEHIKEPKIDESISSSAPQLLTGLPTPNTNGNSPIGSPPIPLPPPMR